jgi:adenylate kinase family enzyme
VAYERIIVVGTTGSGKTTLAGRLADQLGTVHIELDALNWGPDWTMHPDSELRAAVDEATSGHRWVVDGNYSRTRDIVWPRGDTLVWLDYPLPLILWRLWWRTLRRVFFSERLWNDNRERFWPQFLSRESLFLWALQTYRRRRREYPALLQTAEYSHLEVVRLRSPRKTERWLAGVRAVGGALSGDKND